MSLSCQEGACNDKISGYVRGGIARYGDQSSPPMTHGKARENELETRASIAGARAAFIHEMKGELLLS